MCSTATVIIFRAMRSPVSQARRRADGACGSGGGACQAEIAYALGKRYTQDEPLDWGCAVDAPEEDKDRLRKQAIRCAKMSDAMLRA